MRAGRCAYAIYVFHQKNILGVKTQAECGLQPALLCDVISYVTGCGAPMKSDAERMTDLRRRRAAQGLKQITLWVPEDATAEVRDLVKRHLEKRRRQAAALSASTDAAAIAAPALMELLFRFEQKPSSELREKLKGAGFKYHNEHRFWSGTLTSADTKRSAPFSGAGRFSLLRAMP